MAADVDGGPFDGGPGYESVIVWRGDLRTVLGAVDEAIEHLAEDEVQALERLSNAIGYAPRVEGAVARADRGAVMADVPFDLER
jgi:hypothetical protein